MSFGEAVSPKRFGLSSFDQKRLSRVESSPPVISLERNAIILGLGLRISLQEQIKHVWKPVRLKWFFELRLDERPTQFS